MERGKNGTEEAKEEERGSEERNAKKHHKMTSSGV